jgi:hypothetical protein
MIENNLDLLETSSLNHSGIFMMAAESTNYQAADNAHSTGGGGMQILRQRMIRDFTSIDRRKYQKQNSASGGRGRSGA